MERRSTKSGKRNEVHRYYMHLLNVKQWKGVGGIRPTYLQQHPLCELCYKEGKIRAAQDVHHIKPVESVARQGEDLTDAIKLQMEALAYDPHNLIAVCIPHHIQIHRDMNSHYGQMKRQMPDDDSPETDREKNLRNFVEKASDGQATVRRKKPGTKWTPLGWMTQEEFKTRRREQFEEWKAKHERPQPEGDDAKAAEVD